MKALYRLLLCLLLVSIVSIVGCSKSDPVINVADDDPEMIAAIAKARETLPQFWSKFDHPLAGENNFCLKVKIKDGKETEHFWVEKVEKKDNKMFGSALI